MDKPDPVTMSDFKIWREQSITQAYFQEIIGYMEELVANLVTNAGKNPIQDSWNSGKINGLSQLADWRPQIKKEETLDEI